jgi:hypothetical protein
MSTPGQRSDETRLVTRHRQIGAIGRILLLCAVAGMFVALAQAGSRVKFSMAKEGEKTQHYGHMADRLSPDDIVAISERCASFDPGRLVEIVVSEDIAVCEALGTCQLVYRCGLTNIVVRCVDTNLSGFIFRLEKVDTNLHQFITPEVLSLETVAEPIADAESTPGVSRPSFSCVAPGPGAEMADR